MSKNSKKNEIAQAEIVVDEPQTASFEGFMGTVARTTQQTADIMSSVGTAAGSMLDELGNDLQADCDAAMTELGQDLESLKTDRATIKKDLKTTLSRVARNQVQVPQNAINRLGAVQKRVEQLTDRVTDVVVGKTLLPAIKSVTDQVTMQDVADAKEAAHVLDTFEELLGNKPLFGDADPMTKDRARQVLFGE